jgi:hypothetical protein
MTSQQQQSDDEQTTKTCSRHGITMDEGKMASIAKSGLEALPQEENLTESDYKLGEDGKRRRNSENLAGPANRCSQKQKKQTMMPWMKITRTST